jgi:hypothetical protein
MACTRRGFTSGRPGPKRRGAAAPAERIPGQIGAGIRLNAWFTRNPPDWVMPGTGLIVRRIRI